MYLLLFFDLLKYVPNNPPRGRMAKKKVVKTAIINWQIERIHADFE